MTSKQKKSGCGCIPFSFLLLFVGLGIWSAPRLTRINIETARSGDVVAMVKDLTTAPKISRPQAGEVSASIPIPQPTPQIPTNPTVPTSVSTAPLQARPPLQATPAKAATPVTLPTPDLAPTLPAAWQAKTLRGIYLSRYMVTNRASEQMIRERVRYFKAQGINTIIHGVWGNGCTMYKSEVMQQTLGYSSCPNQFQDDWLDWLIDEAHQQGMQVHAYFEKGIKLDENSPIFDIATQRRWFVPGIDKTYPSIDHYLLNVENPEVSKYFRDIQAEFVKKYPTIDAVQWDDYVGYHEAVSGGVDRTRQLTKFMKDLRNAVKQNNPKVSFDVCHHNPYWGKRYFDADWVNWNVDRAFIQVYNDGNFAEELGYVEAHQGISISDEQFSRLPELANNPEVKSVFLFPSAGKPEETAARFRQAVMGQ